MRLVISVVALLLSVNVLAGFNEGILAYEAGDYKTAFDELKPLAEQGDVDAQFSLGVMYQEGKGVIQDYKEAVKWYTKAAEQGDAYAQGALAYMYRYGEGVLQDNVYAHMWGNIASSNGNETGGYFRDQFAKLMTPDQIAEAQQLARECVKKDYKNC